MLGIDLAPVGTELPGAEADDADAATEPSDRSLLHVPHLDMSGCRGPACPPATVSRIFWRRGVFLPSVRRPLLLIGLLAAWLIAAAAADATTPGPAVAVNPSSDHRYVFWRSADGQIHEAWNDGAWHGPINLGWRSASGPAAATTASGHEYVLWRGRDGDIHEAWYIGGWHGPVDLTTSENWGGAGKPSSQLSVAVNPVNDHQYVFWIDGHGRIREAWYDGRWHRPISLGWHATSVPSATGDRLLPPVPVLAGDQPPHPRGLVHRPLARPRRPHCDLPLGQHGKGDDRAGRCRQPAQRAPIRVLAGHRWAYGGSVVRRAAGTHRSRRTGRRRHRCPARHISSCTG